MPDSPRYCVVLGQRVSWTEMLARARETEELGFDALFLVDHFYGLNNLADPTHEGYTMLAALAPFTQRLRLGIMVCGNTYRNPSFLLKQAITVDHISGGRVDFGVGAGWLEREHQAYGFPFPSAKERVERFAEALEIWESLQTKERTTYLGEHYQLYDAPFEPKSLQGRLPVLIGGSKPRMLRLIAKHADIWNAIGSPEDLKDTNAEFDRVCVDASRDPNEIVRTVSTSINLLESAEAFERGALGYHAVGFRDIYLPWPRVERELPVLREAAKFVLPRLRASANVESSGQTHHGPNLRPVVEDDVDALTAALAASPPLARRLVRVLVERPGERIPGDVLGQSVGGATQIEMTLALAAFGDACAKQQIARPWSEAQRGYTIESAVAALLSRAIASASSE